MSDCNRRPVIPQKLPANERQRLSLHSRDSKDCAKSHRSVDSGGVYYTELHNHDKYYKPQQLAEEAESADAHNSMIYMSYVEPLSQNTNTKDTYYFNLNEHSGGSSEESPIYRSYLEPQNTDTNIEDNYFKLNEHSKGMADSSSSSTDQVDGPEESDDETYFVPYVLQDSSTLQQTALEPEGEDKSHLNYVDVVVSSKPKLPLKMTKRDFEQSIKRKVLTNKNGTRGMNSGVSGVVQDEYCSLSQNEAIDKNTFTRDILKNDSNRICADCTNNESKWISCRYFITLCDSCAVIHRKLPHVSNNQLLLIEIHKLYDELQELNNDSSIALFLRILQQAGNDKMNSLFEFQNDSAHNFRLKHDRETFIREKYLNKMFINMSELDVSENYLENLNRIICVDGLSIPIVIYNHFLGANLNYVKLDQTPRDITSEDQVTQLYLQINQALGFSEIARLELLEREFEGEIIQIFDMNSTVHSLAAIDALTKSSIRIQLNKTNMLLVREALDESAQVKLRRRRFELQINYSSVIKIIVHSAQGLIEIKWCNMINHSLVSSYLKYTSGPEQHIWMKHFFLKLLYSYLTSEGVVSIEAGSNNSKLKSVYVNLLNLIDYCCVSLCGFLSLEDTLIKTEGAAEQVFLGLLHSHEGQLNYFKKNLVIVRNSEPFIEIIDLRKVLIQHSDKHIRIDYLNKVYIFKSNGYPQNLQNWYEKISAMSEMKFANIEDNYLTRESVPVLIEKCCSFVELNLIRDRFFYTNCYLQTYKTSQRNNNNKTIANKLLTDRQYELQTFSQGSVTTSDTILYALNQFFSEHVNDRHLKVLIKAAAKSFDISPDMASNIVNGSELDISFNEVALKKFLQKQSYHNPVFHSILKRFCIHFNLLASYTYKNAMDAEYLANFLLSIMFDLRGFIDANSPFVLDKFKLDASVSKFDSDEVYVIAKRLLTDLIIAMTAKCTSLFGLKESYLKIQIEMIEKSIDFREEKLDPRRSGDNLLLTVCYESEADKGVESFQLNASSSYTVGEALEKAKLEFGLEESKYLSLFEVKTENQRNVERALAVKDILIDSLSRWSLFQLCIKYNYVEIELGKLVSDPMLRNFYEECEVLVMCQGCGNYQEDNNGQCSFKSVHKKWRKSYISIQSNAVKIYKNAMKGTGSKKDITFVSYLNSDMQSIEMFQRKTKISHEIKENDLLIYYGLFASMNQENLLESSALDLNTSQTSELNSSKNGESIRISGEECLTLYDKRTGLVSCVHLKSKQSACEWYKKLFQLVYGRDSSWTCFESDHLPDLVKSEPKLYSISIDNSSTVLSDMINKFKKVVKKIDA